MAGVGKVVGVQFENFPTFSQRDVSTLHSLLNHNNDDFFSMRFSPPNFDLGGGRGPSLAATQQLSGEGPASMLNPLQTSPPSGGYPPADAYRPLSLAQQLAAPAMTPHQAASLFVNTNGIDQKVCRFFFGVEKCIFYGVNVAVEGGLIKQELSKNI